MFIQIPGTAKHQGVPRIATFAAECTWSEARSVHLRTHLQCGLSIPLGNRGVNRLLGADQMVLIALIDHKRTNSRV